MKLAAWLTEMLDDVPASVWESIAKDQARDAAALLFAEQAMRADAQPQIRYYCTRCDTVLLRGWSTPGGLVLFHPTVRLSDSRAGQVRGPAGVTSLPRKTAGGMVIPRRAYMLDPRRAVWIGCEHQWGRIDPAQIRADVVEALKTRRTVQRGAKW